MIMKKRAMSLCLAALMAGSCFVGNLSPVYANSMTSQKLKVELKKTYVEMIPDIVYAQVFGMENTALKMDILKPKSDKKLPVVVFVTGGAFLGAPKSNYIQQRVELAEAGYIVASIEYRTLPFARMPEPVQDVKSAIRYLRANADTLGIDVDNIAIMGESAGGYLAAFTGVTNDNSEFDKGDHLDKSSKVKAVIDLYGLSDLTKIGDDYSEAVKATHNSPAATEALLVNGLPLFGGGQSIHERPEAADRANPIKYITKDAPAFLIMHGDKDSMVSPSQTEILHQALVKNGVDSTRYIVEGAEHGGEYWANSEIMDIIIKFLDKNLKNA